ncbi:MAG: GNAT family N-acetyltransferase, partial [Acidimicrobiales bacterium]
MKLRPARPDDAEAIAAANNLAWKSAYRGALPDEALDAIGEHDRADQWRQMATDHPERFVVAVDDDGAVRGFVTVDFAPSGEPDHVGEILGLYVHPQQWRSGAGRLLLDCGCRLLVDEGKTEGVLSTLAEVEATQAFYRSQGWEADGTSHWHRFTSRAVESAELIRMRRPLTRRPELEANRAVWNTNAAWY